MAGLCGGGQPHPQRKPRPSIQQTHLDAGHAHDTCSYCSKGRAESTLTCSSPKIQAIHRSIEHCVCGAFPDVDQSESTLKVCIVHVCHGIPCEDKVNSENVAAARALGDVYVAPWPQRWHIEPRRTRCRRSFAELKNANKVREDIFTIAEASLDRVHCLKPCEGIKAEHQSTTSFATLTLPDVIANFARERRATCRHSGLDRIAVAALPVLASFDVRHGRGPRPDPELQHPLQACLLVGSSRRIGSGCLRLCGVRRRAFTV